MRLSDLAGQYELESWQLDYLRRKILRQHPEEGFLFRKHDGKKFHWILSDEGKDWVDTVYYGDDRPQVEREIDFYLRRIRELENATGTSRPYRVYEAMDIHQIALDMAVSTNRAYAAARLLAARHPEAMLDARPLYISAAGVRWLEENVFKKRYLQDLMTYKIGLQQLEKEMRK